MEEEEDVSPPFWLQNGGADSRLCRSYSLFLSSGALLVCLVVVALAFTLIIVPTLHSFISHVFKPHSVKKSWDSLNFVLVLFAILCGFLSRNTNDNETPRSYDTTQEYEKPNSETPRSWYHYSDQNPSYKSYSRLRSFNSYPDLRQESPWLAADERWRFYDDTHVNGYRKQRPEAREEEEEEEGVKNIEVDVAKDVPTAPLRPASTPPATTEKRRSGEHKNRRASASATTKEFLASLKGKKKKHRHRSVENFQTIQNSEFSTLPSHPPPPPPPPPPPSSVFHNVFSSKKNKHKKLNSASPQPRDHVSSMRVSKTEPFHGGVATLKPRLSNKREELDALEENVITTGNESPLIPIPPPPPPPPFKMPAWKFRVQGDFVRIDSISSSSSGSPDLDDEIVESPTGEDDGEPAILLLYPSSDVDTKADTFIERFRASLRMEKQGIGRSKSNLCPPSKPETK
ncbi:dual specificity protein kinase splA [Abrus precatorius]|uniref:Dual specificity protein kinase splA n=1 Tax=Abrus precatorius TaxID=3816 RepID=A0A8B8KJH1_ABRPR|nr:dual specificity protein kinase splA [Abrus precatorius]